MLGLVAPIARLLNAAVASGSSLPRFGWFSGLPRSLAQLWRQGRQVSPFCLSGCLSVCLSRTESPELVASHDGRSEDESREIRIGQAFDSRTQPLSISLYYTTSLLSTLSPQSALSLFRIR